MPWYGTRRYRIYSENYETVRTVCGLLGMNLTALTTLAENDALRAAMMEKHLNVDHDYWIGLKRDDTYFR